MKVSLYTFVRDGLRLDFHVAAMLRHHLDLADEIIVHEGMSTDATYDVVTAIHPKIKVFRSNWDLNPGMAFINRFKDDARRRCTGDWCVMLDADEFIPEWQFDTLRKRMAAADGALLATSFVNFYGNYRVYNAFPHKLKMPAVKMNIHRNLDTIEMHGGDASSVNVRGAAFEVTDAQLAAEVHHFGTVRRASRLREQWRNMGGRLYNSPAPRFRLPSWLFDLLPHNWADPDFLPYLRIYEGPFCRAVRDDPAEFTRDGMALYNRLRQQADSH
jgi:glycosyltransferase involved in cell wall biosynthesis